LRQLGHTASADRAELFTERIADLAARVPESAPDAAS
jgi:hypothetical protein